MNALIPPLIETVEPHESHIGVRVNPAQLSDDALAALRLATEPNNGGDALRAWLTECLLREKGRRIANADPSAEVPLEASYWQMPWHNWTDDDLRRALATSYSWLGMDLEGDAVTLFDAIHRATLTAACTRLGELHQAIERAKG